MASNVKKVLAEGYTMTNWGTLCTTILPKIQQEETRTLILLIETVYTMILRAHWSRDKSYGFQDLEIWSISDFEWRGLAHPPVLEVSDVAAFSHGGQCATCDETFPSKSELERHQGEVHRLFDCEECGNHYSFQGNLRQHQKDKHEGNIWNCEDCGAVFSSRGSLQKHMKDKHQG